MCRKLPIYSVFISAVLGMTGPRALADRDHVNAFRAALLNRKRPLLKLARYFPAAAREALNAFGRTVNPDSLMNRALPDIGRFVVDDTGLLKARYRRDLTNIKGQPFFINYDVALADPLKLDDDGNVLMTLDAKYRLLFSADLVDSYPGLDPQRASSEAADYAVSIYLASQPLRHPGNFLHDYGVHAALQLAASADDGQPREFMREQVATILGEDSRNTFGDAFGPGLALFDLLTFGASWTEQHSESLQLLSPVDRSAQLQQAIFARANQIGLAIGATQFSLISIPTAEDHYPMGISTINAITKLSPNIELKYEILHYHAPGTEHPADAITPTRLLPLEYQIRQRVTD